MQVRFDEAVTDEDDSTFYFNFLGGLQFTNASQPLEESTSSHVLAFSSIYGLTIFSDLQAVYVCNADKLVQCASKDVGKAGYNLPDTRSVCVAVLSVPNVTHVSLSADELVLACVAQNSVRFYSIPSLASGDTTALSQANVREGSITSFRWSKDAQHVHRYLVVTDEHHLLTAAFPSQPCKIDASGDVYDADWSPTNTAIAYCSNATVTIVDAVDPGFTPQTVYVAHEGVGDADVVRVETLHWVAPNKILLGAVTEEDEAEGDDAFTLMLSLPEGWTPGQDAGEAVCEIFIPIAVEADSTPLLSGPYLHCTAFKPWNVLLAAHRKAIDEHMKLYMTCSPDGGPIPEVLLGEDCLRMALPNGPGGTDNFVLGLALDTCTNIGPVPHPQSQEKDDLAATPTALVFTSDGILRCYRFGHLQVQQCVLQQPHALPAASPAWANTVQHGSAPAAAAGGAAASATDMSMQQGAGIGLSAAEAAAARVGLPEDEEDDWGSDTAAADSHGSGNGPKAAHIRSHAGKRAAEAALHRSTQQQQQQQQQPVGGMPDATKGATTALPDSGGDSDFDSDAQSETHTQIGGQGTVLSQRAGRRGDSDSEDEVTSARAPAAALMQTHIKRQAADQAVAPGAKSVAKVPASTNGFHTIQGSHASSHQPTTTSTGPSFGVFGASSAGGFGAADGGKVAVTSAPAFGLLAAGATSGPAVTFSSNASTGTGAGTSLFGNTLGNAASSATGATSVFGSTGGAFGSGAAFGAGTSSLFGQSTAGTSLFGSSAPAPPALGGGLFGAGTSTAAASSAGTSMFGAAATTTPPDATAAAGAKDSAAATTGASQPATAFNFAGTTFGSSAPAAQKTEDTFKGLGAAFGNFGVAGGNNNSTAPTLFVGTAAAKTTSFAAGVDAGASTTAPAWGTFAGSSAPALGFGNASGAAGFGVMPAASSAPAWGQFATAGTTGFGLFAPKFEAPPQATAAPAAKPSSTGEEAVIDQQADDTQTEEGFGESTPTPLPPPAAPAAAKPKMVTPPPAITKQAPAAQPEQQQQPQATQQASKAPTTAAAAAAVVKPQAKPQTAASKQQQEVAVAKAQKPQAPPPPSVTAPKQHLSAAPKEIAAMESDFLRDVHEVLKLAAQTSRLVAAVAKPTPQQEQYEHEPGLLGAASYVLYQPLSQGVADLQGSVAKLKEACDKSHKDLSNIVARLPDVDRSVAALELLRPSATSSSTTALGGGAGGAAHVLDQAAKKMPLEPALDQLQSRIASQLSGLNRCMDDLTAQLDNLEKTLPITHSKISSTAVASAGGLAKKGSTGVALMTTPSRSQDISSSVLYSTIAMQAETLRNLRSRMAQLKSYMDDLGVTKVPVTGVARLQMSSPAGVASPAGLMLTWAPGGGDAARTGARKTGSASGNAVSRSIANQGGDDDDDEYGAASGEDEEQSVDEQTGRPTHLSTPATGNNMVSRFGATPVAPRSIPRTPLQGTARLSPATPSIAGNAAFRQSIRKALLHATGADEHRGKVRVTTSRRAAMRAHEPPRHVISFGGAGPAGDAAGKAAPAFASTAGIGNMFATPTKSFAVISAVPVPAATSNTGSPTHVSAAATAQPPAKSSTAAGTVTGFSFNLGGTSAPDAGKSGAGFGAPAGGAAGFSFAAGATHAPGAGEAFNAPTPSLGSQKGGTAAAAAATKTVAAKPKASQPPIPSLAQMQSASQQLSRLGMTTAAHSKPAVATTPAAAVAASAASTTAAAKRSAPIKDADKEATDAASAGSTVTSQPVTTAPATTTAAAPSAATKRPASQPPIPTMAAMQKAAALSTAHNKPQAAGGTAASAAPAAAPAPKPKAASSQPPIPNMAQIMSAQQLLTKVAPQPAAAASASSTATTTAPAGAAGSQPAFIGGVFAASSAPPAAASAPAPSLFGSTVPTTPAPAFNFTGLSFGTPSKTAGDSAVPATGTSASPGTGGSFGNLNFGASTSTTSASTTPSLFGSTAGGSLFEAASSAAASASSQASSLFASTPAATAAATTSATGTGLFGFSPATGTAAASAPSLFGSATATPGFNFTSTPATATSAAAPATSATSVFGSFGAATPPAAAAASGTAPAPATAAAGGVTSAFGSFGFGASAGTTPTTTSAPFGAPTSIFGATTPQPPATGGLFGQTSPASGSSMFGSAATSAFGAQTSASPSAFGAPTPTSAFGSVTAPAFGTSTPFGSAAPAPPATAGGSVFGSATPAGGGGASAFGAGFGQPAGAGAFGATTPAFGAPAGFGAPTPPAAAFGQSSVFGASTPFGSGTAFGSAAPTPHATGGGAFGAAAPAAPATTGGGFASFAQPGGGFNAFASQAGGGGNAFGAAAAAPAAGSGFGAFGAAAGGGNAFGAAAGGGAPFGGAAAFGGAGNTAGGFGSSTPSSGAANMWAPRK